MEEHIYKLSILKSVFGEDFFCTGEQNERPEARELNFLQSDLGANFLRQCAVMGPNPVKGLFFLHKASLFKVGYILPNIRLV